MLFLLTEVAKYFEIVLPSIIQGEEKEAGGSNGQPHFTYCGGNVH